MMRQLGYMVVCGVLMAFAILLRDSVQPYVPQFVCDFILIVTGGIVGEIFNWANEEGK